MEGVVILGRPITEPPSHVRLLDLSEVAAAVAAAKAEFLSKCPDTPAESADRWWPKVPK